MLLTRIQLLQKDIHFLKSLELAFLEFENKYNVCSRQHFADKLNYKTSNEFSNHLQPFTEKFLKLDELFIILDNLGEFKKIPLDYICAKYNLVCSNKALNSKFSNDENIKDLLLNISGSNGKIFSDFIDFNQDKKLDKTELESLIKSSYQARALLNEFEHTLKNMLRDSL